MTFLGTAPADAVGRLRPVVVVVHRRGVSPPSSMTNANGAMEQNFRFVRVTPVYSTYIFHIPIEG
jgi:hypothetical protein